MDDTIDILHCLDQSFFIGEVGDEGGCKGIFAVFLVEDVGEPFTGFADYASDFVAALEELVCCVRSDVALLVEISKAVSC